MAQLGNDNLNHLLTITSLGNRYYAMRHGHSTANQQGIIVSHPANGCEQFGLSELGRKQVEQSLQQSEYFDADTIVISSDFQRARETAEVAHRMYDCEMAVCLESRLRERYFGELELSSDSGYDAIWSEDAANPDSQPRGVESANQVMARMTAAITDFEDRFSDATLLLVSHGDALQILQTAFARKDGSKHRQLEHLRTAEIRRLVLAE